MTINEASKVIQDLLIKIEPPTETRLGWLETWIHKKDIKGFRVAIETMHKYQKIEEIYKEWFSDAGKTSADAYIKIGEVLKDGNVD